MRYKMSLSSGNETTSMTLKSFIVSVLIFLSAGTCWAQSDQEIMQELQIYAATAQSKYQTAKSMMDISQMAGDANQYQLAQYELQYAEQFYNYLNGCASNPAALRNPSALQQLRNNAWEYSYRTEYRDYRPYNQIVGNLQQWVAQRQWESSTPQGQQAYNARRQAAQQNFENHQARHAQANAAFDSYMNSLRASSDQQYKNHQQYVNTIYDRYQYVNPYDGQVYTVPNTYNANPVVQNPDGSYTELVPYQNW